MTKRKKFVFTSVFLSLGLIAVQLVKLEVRYQAIAGLTLLSGLLTAWVLYKDLSGIEWLPILILPIFYTAGSGLFYFLLPEKWLSRFLVAGLYGVGVYALLCTENIYSVAAIRTIQLLRAAQTVGFLLTLATAFFLFDTIFSLRLQFWLNFSLSFLAAFPLVLQSLWSVELEERISQMVLFYTLILSLILAETALFLSFWPVTVATGSLFLTTTLYVLLGIAQENFKERLFKKALKEYLWVGAIVFLTTFLITRWG